MAILYGIIQGIAEFLPISSSGHLALLQSLFGLDGTEGYFTFNIMLHLGTLAAVLLAFRRDISSLIAASFRVCRKLFTGKLFIRVEFKNDQASYSPKNKKHKHLALNADKHERLVLLVIFGTVPLALTFLFRDQVELLYLYPKLIGGILILNGVMLYVSDRLGSGKKTFSEATPTDGLVVGLFQTIAVFPGLSRSASTITAGLLRDLDRELAVEYSFLLSIPAILGAAVFEIPDMMTEIASSSISDPILKENVVSYILGTFTAAIVGFAAIKLLKYISKSSDFTFFAYYCWLIGVLAVILL